MILMRIFNHLLESRGYFDFESDFFLTTNLLFVNDESYFFFPDSLEKSNGLFMFFQGLRSYNLAVSERRFLFASLKNDYSQFIVKSNMDQLVFSSK